jgi:hypothetical protein
MPTWEETKQHLREKFHLAAVEEDWVGLVWSFPGGAEPVRQRQRVERATAFGEPHVLVLADVLPADRVDAAQALAHNMTVACGGLAIAEGTLVVRLVLPLQDLSFAFLDRSLEYLAHEAARLRGVLGGGTPGASA